MTVLGITFLSKGKDTEPSSRCNIIKVIAMKEHDFQLDKEVNPYSAEHMTVEYNQSIFFNKCDPMVF